MTLNNEFRDEFFQERRSFRTDCLFLLYIIYYRNFQDTEDRLADWQRHSQLPTIDTFYSIPIYLHSHHLPALQERLAREEDGRLSEDV